MHSGTFLKRERTGLWQFSFIQCYSVYSELSKMFIHCVFWIPSTKWKMFTLNRNFINHNLLSFYLSKLICFYFTLPSLHSGYIKVSFVLWTGFAFSAILILFLAQRRAHRKCKCLTECLKAIVSFNCLPRYIFLFKSY